MSYSRINSSMDCISADRITTVGKKMGESAYVEVVAGLLDNETPIVIKRLKEFVSTGQFPEIRQQKLQELENELDIFFQLKKTSKVVFCYGYQKVPYSLIMENAGIGLNEYIETHKATLSLSSGCEIMEGISQAVHFFHDMQYVHRDIKSDNILISETGQVKLCDFGAAAKLEEDDYLTGYFGTVCWMAPEIIRRECYNEKVDIFSLGVVFWEVTMRNSTPYANMSPMQVINHVSMGQRERIPDDFHPDLRSLITTCWQDDPQKRPNAREVVNHLQSIKNNLATFFSQSFAPNRLGTDQPVNPRENKQFNCK